MVQRKIENIYFLDTDLLGAAFGRNQIKKLKCKMKNFGILASQDNSLLFQ